MHQYSSLAQGLPSYLSIFHFKGILISALHIIYKIWKMIFRFRKPLGNWSHPPLQKHLMIKVNTGTLRQHDGQLLEFLSLTNKWFIFRASAWKASPWPEQKGMLMWTVLHHCSHAKGFFYFLLSRGIWDSTSSLFNVSSFFPFHTVTGPVVFINADIFHSSVKHHGGGRFHPTLLSLVIFVIPMILQY